MSHVFTNMATSVDGAAVEVQVVAGVGEGGGAGKVVEGDFLPIAADAVGDGGEVFGKETEEGNAVGREVDGILEISARSEAIGIEQFGARPEGEPGFVIGDDDVIGLHDLRGNLFEGGGAASVPAGDGDQVAQRRAQ